MVPQEYLYFFKRKPNVLVANGSAPSCKKTKQNLPYYIYAPGGRTLAATNTSLALPYVSRWIVRRGKGR